MRSSPTLVALYLSVFSVLQCSHALEISVQPGTGVDEITVGRLVNIGLSWGGGDPSPLDIRIVDSKDNWNFYVKAKNDVTLASNYFPSVNLNNQPFRVEAITQDGTLCVAHSDNFIVKASPGYATITTTSSPTQAKPPPTTTATTNVKSDVTPTSSSSRTTGTSSATNLTTSSTAGETETTGPTINNFGTITYSSGASGSLQTDSLSGTTTLPTGGSKHVSLGAIIGGVIGGIFLLALIAFIVILLLRRRRSARNDSLAKSDLADRPFFSLSNPSTAGAPSPTMSTSERLVKGSSPQLRDDISLGTDTREVGSEQELMRHQILELSRRVVEMEAREHDGPSIRDSAPPDYRTIV